MNNASLFSADRATHLKIVAAALIASIAVMTVVIAARPDHGEPETRQAGTAVIKPAKPVTASARTGSSIR